MVRSLTETMSRLKNSLALEKLLVKNNALFPYRSIKVNESSESTNLSRHSVKTGVDFGPEPLHIGPACRPEEPPNTKSKKSPDKWS